MVEPLIEKLLTLASCNIRLGKEPDLALQDLAYRPAALATVNLEEPSEFIRYSDLPRELQYRILEYTDLVTQCREITWNPKQGFYLRFRLEICTLQTVRPRITSLVSFGVALAALE